MLPSRTVLAVIVSLSLLCACEEDQTTKNAARLIGYWELTGATRNQRPTAVLDHCHFEFLADGTLLTNLPLRPDLATGEEISDRYELVKSSIEQKKIPLTYQINHISDSTLTLSMEMRSVPFELLFRKTTRPPKAEETTKDSTEMPIDTISY